VRTIRRSLPGFGLILVVTVGALSLVGTAADRLPDRLSDPDFWKIVSEFSEPSGFFRSDNLLSNEIGFPDVIPLLVKTAQPARAYLGVGPEQNFTYIAALQPKMAFIVDVRRGNRDLHLMYKALFELSANRADFVSRLFSRERVETLTPQPTAQDILAAYASVDSSAALYNTNVKAIQDHLVITHRLPLSPEDLEGIEHVYRAFYTFGPTIQYSSNAGGFGSMPSYVQLMIATDASGQARSYLSTEEGFSFLKALQSKNLVVPIVGNFSGPKAIRAIGAYLNDRGATVSAFYLSNVETYLSSAGWSRFCEHVATLPLDETSTFIRSLRGGRIGPSGGMTLDLAAMAAEVKDCAFVGR